MTVLENKIKKNRDSFDAVEPPEGHFERFGEKLDAEYKKEEVKKRFFSSKVYRIAAVVIIFISISAIIFFVNPRESSVNMYANELPEELQEVKVYYDGQVGQKMKQIEECAMTDEDAAIINELVKQEIEQLDATELELKEALKDNDKNEKVKNALIENYKTKSEILDNIIQRLCSI